MCVAACAFVTYERWSQCEAAIEAHTGKTHLEGAKMPMVVKFADAKSEGPAAGMGGGPGAGGGVGKRSFNSMDAGGGSGLSKRPYGGGMMPGGGGMMMMGGGGGMMPGGGGGYSMGYGGYGMGGGGGGFDPMASMSPMGGMVRVATIGVWRGLACCLSLLPGLGFFRIVSMLCRIQPGPGLIAYLLDTNCFFPTSFFLPWM